MEKITTGGGIIINQQANCVDIVLEPISGCISSFNFTGVREFEMWIYKGTPEPVKLPVWNSLFLPPDPIIRPDLKRGNKHPGAAPWQTEVITNGKIIYRVFGVYKETMKGSYPLLVAPCRLTKPDKYTWHVDWYNQGFGGPDFNDACMRIEFQ